MSSVSSSTSTPIRLGTGLSSGLPTESIISQLVQASSGPITQLNNKKTKLTQQQTAYSNVKSRVDALMTAIKKLTVDTSSVLSNGKDIFQSKKVTSSNESTITATASNTAAIQNTSIEVVSLATQTKAKSTTAVGGLLQGTTNISQAALGTISTGNFTVYVNGVANSIAVNTGDTINDVLGRVNALAGGPAEINATVAGGKVNLEFNDTSHVVTLGASTDTSNFLKAMKLLPGATVDNGATSTTSSMATILAFNPNVAIDGGTAGNVTPLTAGSTFTINGKTFDTTAKSLNSLISEINNSGAKVTASFNPNSNAFELTANDPGSTYISLTDTTGNFLTAMGLITAGNTTASQTIGANAQIKINGGPAIYSPTNIVDESITGLTGVTLTLLDDDPTPVTLNVGRDTEAVETALTDFVKAFNDTLSYIDQQTASNQDANKRGILNGESSVKSFRQTLRQLVTDSLAASGAYKSLQDIGISTGAVTGTASTTSSTLVFDKSKFEAALIADPDAVRKVVNGRAASDGFDGTLTRLEASLKSALGTLATTGTDGIFAAFTTSSSNRITGINDSIKRKQASLDAYEANLRRQFSAMETMITQYQSQGTALTNLSNQLSKSN